MIKNAGFMGKPFLSHVDKQGIFPERNGLCFYGAVVGEEGKI